MFQHKCLAERIGGDDVIVRTVLSPGQSHGSFDPTPKQLVELSSASIYFVVGVEMERSIVARLKELNPAMKVVDLQAGIELIPFGFDQSHEHSAECDHGHEPGQPDPHTWLDPLLFARQGHNMAEGMAELLPEKSGAFRSRAAELEKELKALHDEIARELAPLKGSQLFAYHAAYGYFAKRYGLKQVAIEAGGREPGAEYLARITQRAKEAKAGLVVVQPQYSKAQAESVARSVGAGVVAMDHMSEHYFESMREMAAAIRSHSSTKGEGGE